MAATKHDAIVIGAGPAGASCAHTLAKQGHSVLLLEKAQHPRFHIGESLIPYLAGLWEKMGILHRMQGEPTFLLKEGVEIKDDTTPESRKIDFKLLKEGVKRFSFNVERARLDQILTEEAAKANAQVRQQAEVKKLLFDGDRMSGVTYDHQGETHEAKARYVVDASGRAGLVARHFGLRRMNPRLRNIAFFNHYHDCDWEKNASADGYQVLAMHKDGWIWCIPVGPRALSIGTVMPAALAKTAEPQRLFDEHLGRVPHVSQCLTRAKPQFDTLKAESDFCYHSNRLAGPGWLLVGDAGCFVDPLFSGGVFLGSVTGYMAAKSVHNMIGGADEKKEGTAYGNFVKTGYDGYFRLVYGFYEKGTIPDLFWSYRVPYPFCLQFVTGNFWAQKNDPLLSLLRSKPEWNTFEEPFEYVDQCPIYPDTYYRAGEDVSAVTPPEFRPRAVVHHGPPGGPGGPPRGGSPHKGVP
jgi:FADH2-dependent halogenase/halogenation protein CepH